MFITMSPPRPHTQTSSASPSISTAILAPCTALCTLIMTFGDAIADPPETIFDPVQPIRAENPTEYDDQNWFERRMIDFFICGGAYRNRLCSQTDVFQVWKSERIDKDSRGVTGCCSAGISFAFSSGRSLQIGGSLGGTVGCVTGELNGSYTWTSQDEFSVQLPASPCFCVGVQMRQRMRFRTSVREYVPRSQTACNFEVSYVRYHATEPDADREFIPVFYRSTTTICPGCTGDEPLPPEPPLLLPPTPSPTTQLPPQIDVDMKQMFATIDAGHRTCLNFHPLNVAPSPQRSCRLLMSSVSPETLHRCK
jgi:hypothetical protein